MYGYVNIEKGCDADVVRVWLVSEGQRARGSGVSGVVKGCNADGTKKNHR